MYMWSETYLEFLVHQNCWDTFVKFSALGVTWEVFALHCSFLIFCCRDFPFSWDHTCLRKCYIYGNWGVEIPTKMFIRSKPKQVRAQKTQIRLEEATLKKFFYALVTSKDRGGVAKGRKFKQCKSDLAKQKFWCFDRLVYRVRICSATWWKIRLY